MEVLRIGQEKLSDKGIRSADKRVGPLSQQTGLSRQAIVDHMVARFADAYPSRPDELTADELAEAERRVAARFGRREWIHLLP